MALYVTVREGPAADRTEPLLVTGDQRVVRAVLATLADIARQSDDTPRVGNATGQHSDRRVSALKSVPRNEGE